MYKHQVIGIRRENSWRSRRSDHIVGMCTLEAVDANGRFESFDPKEDWRAVRGGVTVEPRGGSHDGLTPACRYWSLEEVLVAMKSSTPRNEFYTRDPRQRKIPVFSYVGKWVKTRGDSRKPGNLNSLMETPVDCPRKRCTVIPRAARPVSRGYGPDC